MNWSTQDNKEQRGKIDRIYVSATEYYELKHFIHHYLETRKISGERQEYQNCSCRH